MSPGMGRTACYFPLSSFCFFFLAVVGGRRSGSPVRGQRWIQAIHGWPGPSMDGLTSTVGLAEAGHPWMAWPSPLK